jgi:hypothetical protein
MNTKRSMPRSSAIARTARGEKRPDLHELQLAPRVEARPEDERAPARTPRADYWPIGCHTVLSSRKLEISYGLCTSLRPRTMRLTFSAASSSSSVE